MNETFVTIVGAVATAPERKQVLGGHTVVNFRVASNERWFDRSADDWTRGDSLFVDVSCWEVLADNVYAAFSVGDPIIVRGRLCTDDYERDGHRRSSVKLKATAIGPDLKRSTAVISRVRRDDAQLSMAVDAAGGTGVQEDADVPGAGRSVGERRAVPAGGRAGEGAADLPSDDQRDRLGAAVEAGVRA